MHKSKTFVDKRGNVHPLNGLFGYNRIKTVENGEVTIDDLAIERETEYATWCIEDGELEEAAKIISRLIDAKGGE